MLAPGMLAPSVTALFCREMSALRQLTKKGYGTSRVTADRYTMTVVMGMRIRLIGMESKGMV